MNNLHKALTTFIFVFVIQTNAQAECTSAAIPIIPDGIVASKDDMVSASKAIKKMQRDLTQYRNCLTKQSLVITETDEESELKKQAILDLYNESIDLEQKAADKFNQSLKAYNSK